MQLCIKYLLGRMDGVGDNNDSRYIFFAASLINSTSNHEKFRFGAGNIGCMMNCLD